MRFRFALSTTLACFSVTQAVFAQGMTEYGSVLGAQGKPNSSYGNTVNNVYNSAAARIGGMTSGSSASSIGSFHSSVDPEDAVAYGKQANQYYLAAQKSLKAGNQKDAIKLYSSALTIRERVWGDKDPAVAQILREQADIYRKQGELHECENNYRRVLACNIKRFGPGTKELDPTLSLLADLCERECNTTDALSYYQQLVAIRQKFNAPDSEPLKSARLSLAHTQIETFNYPNAEKILTDAIAHEDASANPDKTYLCKVLDVYGGLLRETYREDEAVKVETRQHELAAQLKDSKEGPPKSPPVALPATANAAAPAQPPASPAAAPATDTAPAAHK